MSVLPRLRFYNSGKKIVFLSVVTPCTLIDRFQLFWATYSLQLQPIYAEDGDIMLLIHLQGLWYSEHAGSMPLLHNIQYIVDCMPAHCGADSPEYSLIIVSLCALSAKSPTWECAVFCTDITEPSGFMGPTSSGRPQWSYHGLQSVTSARWRMVWWVILLL